jgi:hypothetical protein
MTQVDFLTNVETAFLQLFANDPLLKLYNWERWDTDKEVKLPRGYISLRASMEPDETPWRRLDVTVTFEGRPKKSKLSVVMAGLITLLANKNNLDLMTASGNTVKFFGRAESVTEERRISSGLRVWSFTFAVHALPMV